MGRPKGTENRDKVKLVRYTQKELQLLEKDFASSSCPTINQYIRDLSLRSPFDIYRNKSFDAFVDELILLRKDLQDIERKPTLTKENETRLLQLHKDISSSINKLIDLCMQK